MTKLIRHIISRRLPCFFISPHLDDAALSAACLMRFLVNRGVPVTVINVFTRALDGPQTLSAQRLVHLSGYSTASSLYLARLTEDAQALATIGVKVINLDYTDAPWRRRPDQPRLVQSLATLIPEVSHLYPVHRLHITSGRVSPHDLGLIGLLAARLQLLIPQSAAVFCPQAIGGHVDHCLVRSAVESRFHPVLWLDQPYAQRVASSPDGFTFPTRHPFKKTVLRLYKTQIGLLFPSGKIPLLEERFIFPHAH